MPDVIKGKYQIVREIARSNDIVYEAIDTTFGRKIAIKELNIAAGSGDQARRERIERFNREARAAGRLSHPNIVSVFDFGEENGRYFIAMEYLEGQSLRDAMQARGAYPLHEALAIMYQVLDALSYAHANRVIHRDIKPDNIHILPGGHAKITDFGIARISEEPALTGDGQVFGTPSYMSPEQIEGKGIDFRSDIFSAGVLLYEMLAGRKPFIGDSVISITYAIMHAEPAPLNGIPQGIDQVIRRALSKQPQYRQISADQMKLDLKSAEQTPPMFLSGQTNMGGYGSGATGYGYGAASSQVGYGYNPNNTGYSNTPVQPNVYTGGLPGYAPPAPSQSQPGGGLPWSWNTQGSQPPPMSGANQQYPQPGQQQPGQPPPATGLPYPYSSPPFPAITPPPVIVLSPGAKTGLRAVGAAVALGTVLALTIIAVQKGYDQYQEEGNAAAVNSDMKQGADAYGRDDYDAAVTFFMKAKSENPSDEQRQKISTNLAYSLVKRARLEIAGGSLKQARADYEQALKEWPGYGVAEDELSQLLKRMGDNAGAQEHSDSGGGASGASQPPPAKLDLSKPPPSAPQSQGRDSFISDRRRQAAELIKEGDQLSASGDSSGAAEKWRKALELAPGEPEGDAANQRLYPGSQGANSDSQGF